MKNVKDIISELGSTSSSTEKVKILKENKNNKNFLMVLSLAYNTISINYFVKKVPIAKKSGTYTLDDSNGISILQELLMDLSNRKVTGNSALDLIKYVLEKYTPEYQEIITNIIKRDLKEGTGVTLINTAIPDLIPVFDVVLAKNYNEHSSKVETGEWKISTKIDGCRCIAIKMDNTFEFYSRQGKQFFTLDNLIPKLLEQTKGMDDVVFDGEICLVDKNGKEDFQGIMKEIKKKDHSIKNPKYKLFDLLTKEEFYSCNGKNTFNDRYNKLKKLIKDCDSFDVLEQYDFNDDSFSKLQIKVKEEGWEGLMLRRADVPYKNKRTDHLLKVKNFLDDEYVVESIDTGEFQYTSQGTGQKSEVMMTAVHIKHKGYDVKVGSGFSIDQRKDFYKNPSKIIGKTINCQYFEETKNQNGGISLRFPTVKHIYDNGREV
jgi:DNA ligase 1